MTDNLTNRAREIVKLAATFTSLSSVREWLLRDERGHWEQTAAQLLTTDNVKEKTASLNLNEEQVNTELARYIAFLACDAMLKDAKKRRRGRPA